MLKYFHVRYCQKKSIVRTVFSTIGCSFSFHNIIVYCGVAYSDHPFLSQTLEVASAFDIILRRTSSLFVWFIWPCAPKYKRGDFIFSLCIHPIGNPVTRLGVSHQRSFLLRGCYSMAAMLFVADVACLSSHDFCCVPSNERHTFDYGSCPCSDLYCRILDGYLPKVMRRSFACNQLLVFKKAF